VKDAAADLLNKGLPALQRPKPGIYNPQEADANRSSPEDTVSPPTNSTNK